VWNSSEELNCKASLIQGRKSFLGLDYGFPVSESLDRLSLKGNIRSDVMVYTCNPAFRRLRQKDLEFKASLGCLARPCLKNNKANLLYLLKLFCLWQLKWIASGLIQLYTEASLSGVRAFFGWEWHFEPRDSHLAKQMPYGLSHSSRQFCSG
jgi:hypothetical protein